MARLLLSMLRIVSIFQLSALNFLTFAAQIALYNLDLTKYSPALIEPLVLNVSSSINEIIISVNAVRIDHGLFAYNTRAYCFHPPSGGEPLCSVPGPTIMLAQGDTVKYDFSLTFFVLFELSCF